MQLGALASGADKATLDQLATFAARIGLAFQVVDDLLDVTADTGTLGKTAGVDRVQGKNTYPGLIGVAQSREFAEDLLDGALRDIDGLGLSDSALATLARIVVERVH